MACTAPWGVIRSADGPVHGPWSPFAYERHGAATSSKMRARQKVDCLAVRGVPARDEAFERAAEPEGLCRWKGDTRVSWREYFRMGQERAFPDLDRARLSRSSMSAGVAGPDGSRAAKRRSTSRGFRLQSCKGVARDGSSLLREGRVRYNYSAHVCSYRKRKQRRRISAWPT